MLEDDFTYVIRKAFKGLGIAPGEAATRAGLAENEVMTFYRGNFSAETARLLAPVLELNQDALAGHNSYHPEPLEIPEIHRQKLPFNNENVNTWLVESSAGTVLFDTGYDPGSCLEALGEKRPNIVLVTHNHPDHIGGVMDFVRLGIPIQGPDIDHASPNRPGSSIRCGPLTITTCDLSGHCIPAVGYHIAGLNRPVLVTGDAIFAGSIGGCATPALYQDALRQIHEIIAPLPDDTILLPGHGPATTLGEERKGNPFIA